MSGLRWGLKESLRAYILGMADGAIELSDGAVDDDGVPVFPAVAGSDDGTLRFHGRAVFTGHDGMMRVALVDPWLEPVGAGWTLSISDDESPGGRLTLATVAASERDAEGGLRGRGTLLTADGADLFFGPYREGTELDDPVIVL